jgi:hypothetical protein
MASGILGQSALAATTNTTVYTVPASTHAVVNVSILNRSGSAAATIRLALSATGSPGNAEWIEYDVSIPKNGILERTAISLNAGKNIVAYTDGTDMSVSVYGIEQAT